MKKIRVTSSSKPRLPILFTICIYLLMDKLQLGGIWVGVVSTIVTIIWGIMIYVYINMDVVKLFDEDGFIDSKLLRNNNSSFERQTASKK